MWEEADEDRQPCPNCGSGDIAEIRYGLPDFEDDDLHRALDEKRIVLGGCIVWSTCPKWFGHNCRHKWGRARDGNGNGNNDGDERS